LSRGAEKRRPPLLAFRRRTRKLRVGCLALGLLAPPHRFPCQQPHLPAQSCHQHCGRQGQKREDDGERRAQLLDIAHLLETVVDRILNRALQMRCCSQRCLVGRMPFKKPGQKHL